MLSLTYSIQFNSIRFDRISNSNQACKWDLAYHVHTMFLQSWLEVLAPLVNMIKEACKDKSVLFKICLEEDVCL